MSILPHADRQRKTVPGDGRLKWGLCCESWVGLDVTDKAFRVLVALAVHANWDKKKGSTGICNPSRETIMAKTGLRYSTRVSEALRELESVRVITTVRADRNNRYFVRNPGHTYQMPPSDPVGTQPAQTGHEFFRAACQRGRFASDESGRLVAFEAALPEDRVYDWVFAEYARHWGVKKLDRQIRGALGIGLHSHLKRRAGTQAGMEVCSLPGVEEIEPF